MRKSRCFFTKIKNKIQHHTEALANITQEKPTINSAGKGNKCIQTWKEEIKLFTDSMIVYVGNSKEMTNKLLELINYIKVTRHILIHKSQLFSYIPAVENWSFKQTIK